MIDSFDGNVANAVNILSLDLSNDAIFRNAYGVAENISSNVIAPTATSIVAICFLIDFIKTTIKIDGLKWEHVISVVLKFTIAKAAIGIVPDFILNIYAIGGGWVTTAAGNLGAGGLGDLGTQISSMIYDETTGKSVFSWFQSIICGLMMSIIFLAVMVSGILVVVMAYARAFEIILYISVAPLPFAFILMDNANVAKRFALQFLGVVLQGVLMIVIILMFRALCTAIIANTTTLLGGLDPANPWITMIGMAGQMLVAVICLVASVMKSGSLAKQMLSA
jgi:hypothetical protein